MTISDKFKFSLLKSRLGRLIRDIESRLIVLKMMFSNSKKANRKTVYCISPYKTGTTYLSSSFNPEISQHEPIHYTSYKVLDRDFDKYFAKRLNYLDLKLECSGSWSAYIEEMANNKVAKDLEYICVLRSPSSWITSVINYWNKTNMLKFHFDIPLEFFWKHKVGVDLRAFDFKKDNKENQEIIDKLIKFYFDFTEKTKLLKNVTYIDLKDIGDSIPKVEELIDEKAAVKDSWKRENKKKQFIYKNDSIDEAYNQLTAGLVEKKKHEPMVRRLVS
ncbi:hypothetical protein [Winogradskyella luteola]|uniref:Sulfotransferase domain-containing protein n=1 Tax=Winogradskyella luteola TaxID=2828330 RepID=A0A9X1F7R1_9FLAO|nr:hypothetical protein [Winogradskyella luteola]MBV7268008.1 hypothetical protein [Winogradskyella luteola]